ncbi:MAG TPA: LysR substrate-binding domain-containing protein [Steroidobacteraceae bacterium]|nr:LysR substrate-binding domain-containing protein [Steroidobacteraceae bacterium]
MQRPLRPRPLPKLLGLQAFEATARLGSVSRAAVELCLTQGAVSRQILALEAHLGVQLFHRSKKRLILSEAGAGYLHDVRGGLSALADATDALVSLRGRGGTLRLATLPTFGARWLVPRLGRFCESHPHITIDLITRLAPFDFSIEQIDGAIHFGGREWPGATAQFLAKEEMTVVATPALARRCPTPADVLEAPLLQITSRAFSWREWLTSIGLRDAVYTPFLQVETFAMGIEAVLAGLCVGILPTFFIAPEIAAGTLVAIGSNVTSESAYYFVYPERKREYFPLHEFARWITSEISG